MAEQVPNVIGSLQNKLNNQSFNPQEYSNEQLHVKLSDGCLDFWALMMIEAYAILKYKVF
jgi:hypothetical protein